MENQKMEATTGENGVARGIDILFQNVKGVRNRLKAWAEGVNNKVFECDVMPESHSLTKEDLSKNISEKEYDLLRSKEVLTNANQIYACAQSQELIVMEKLKRLKSECENLEAEVKKKRSCYENLKASVVRLEPNVGKIRAEYEKAKEKTYGKDTPETIKKQNELINTVSVVAREKAAEEKAKIEFQTAVKENGRRHTEYGNIEAEYKQAKERTLEAEKARREAFVKVATLEKLLAK